MALLAPLVALALTLACAQPPPATDIYPALTKPPPATPTPVADDPEPTAEPAAQYDPNRTMFRIWEQFGHPHETTLAAFADAAAHNDVSQAVVILEALKFFRLDTARSAIETLTVLTGQDFDFDRRRWREWLGPRREEYAPPPDYARWKVNSLALIDPEIAAVLHPAIAHSRVDLTEVVWGGVRLDGIPPLENPPYVGPEQAAWLGPDDRVFGVSINGERRAYPLRVMNAHELANDVLGGEPISLVY